MLNVVDSRAEGRRRLSSVVFSTLIEAWASMKSFVPRACLHREPSGSALPTLNPDTQRTIGLVAEPLEMAGRQPNIAPELLVGDGAPPKFDPAWVRRSLRGGT